MMPAAFHPPASLALLNDRRRNDDFHLYVRCLFIRKFERKLLDLFALGKLSGTTHTGVGQEATAVGLAAACRDSDVVVSNHRCHAHLLAHVGAPDKLINEVMGNAAGFCGGLGGSQHICVKDRFFSNGIQGGILPLAAGLAFAKKRQGSDDIVCVFMGDGTTGEGAVYEALNLAACHKVPLLVIVEDNEIAQTTPTCNTIAGTIRQRFEAFGFTVFEANCPTAGEMYQIASPVVERVRSGQPAALIVKSARLGPHSKGDDTRSKEVIASWTERDPMCRMLEALRPSGRLEEAESLVDEWLDSLNPIINATPEPASLCQPSYIAPHLSKSDLQEIDGRIFLERLNVQLAGYLERFPDALLIGEDIGDPYGGAFKVTKGLQTRFPNRVVETPISELGFTGLAAGAALLGMRPVIEMMFGDFTLLAFDQLANHAAKYPLMYNGQVDCPLIVRVAMGGGRGYGPTHSQNLEKHLCGLPNLQVLAVSPYLPLQPIYDALKAAKGPVVLVEHKADYTRKIDKDTHIAKDFNAVIIDGGILYTPKHAADRPILICAYGGQIALAMDAARQLAANGVAAHVLAFMTLHPLNEQALHGARIENPYQLVVTLEESSTAWGFGSEIAATLLLPAFSGFTDGFLRLGAIDTIIPASRALEKQMLPDVAKVVAAVQDALSPTPSSSELPPAIPASVASIVTDASALDIVEVKALQLNANDDEVKVVEFLVSDGSEVAFDHPIMTLETSKASAEITAPANGIIAFCCTKDEDVPIGAVIARIYKTHADMEAHRAMQLQEQTPPPAPTLAPAAAGRNVLARSATTINEGEELVPLTKVQIGMNKTLRISHDEIVPAYLLAECQLQKPTGRKTDLLDVVIHHAARLTAKYPNLNARLDDNGIVRRTTVHFGFTADNRGDLYMGVVREAQAKSIEQITAERMEIILSLFRGEVDQSMIAEPTICVTSLNGRRFSHQLPVVFPQTALMIGFNQKPSDDGMVFASITFAYDHRILSGYEVSRFADELISALIEHR